MNTIAVSASGETPALKVTQSRVLLSEFTKFRSLRSTVYTLLVAVIMLIGIGVLFAAVSTSQYDGPGAAPSSFDPLGASLSGVSFAQIAIGVLGVLMMGGEYATGMIRSSLAIVPSRLPVLWGKLIVFAGIAFAISVVASFIAFFAGQALFRGHHLDVAITAPGALRSVFGAALYLTVAGLIGIALGALLRNTAAGISTFVALFFIISPLAGLLPSAIRDHLAPYLPSNAGSAIYGGTQGVENPLAPWTGFAVFCVYALILIGAAAVRLRRADV
jgi:ABC-type transport system involved in multi-copper enzyme maturation permease subunit